MSMSKYASKADYEKAHGDATSSRALWLADKLTGDYGSEAAQLLRWYASNVPVAQTGERSQQGQQAEVAPSSEPRVAEVADATSAGDSFLLQCGGPSGCKLNGNGHTWCIDNSKCLLDASGLVASSETAMLNQVEQNQPSSNPSAIARAEWVSVDKKLPPLQQIVLVLTTGGSFALDYLVSDPNPQHSHWAAHGAEEVHFWHEVPNAPSHLPRGAVAP